MKSQYLLFLCLFQIMNTIPIKKANYKYILNPETTVGIIFNFSSKAKLSSKLKSSFIPEEVIKLILKYINDQGALPKKIDHQIINNKYSLDDYYGKVYKGNNLFYFKIFHTTVKASQNKLKYNVNEVKKELLKESRIKMEEKNKKLFFEINKMKN